MAYVVAGARHRRAVDRRGPQRPRRDGAAVVGRGRGGRREQRAAAARTAVAMPARSGTSIVEPNGITCVCGAQGCLWAYASAAALQAEMNRPAAAGAGAGHRPHRSDDRPRAGVGRGDLRHPPCAAHRHRPGDVRVGSARRRRPRSSTSASRLAHLRSMPDRARPLVQVGVSHLGREAALIGAAGIGRLAQRERRRGRHTADVPTTRGDAPAPTLGC